MGFILIIHIFARFRTEMEIGAGYIWDNIESPSTTSTGNWDIYNDTLKTILTLQLSQYSFNDRLTLFSGYSSGTTILSELNNNIDNNTYMIAFLGKDINNKIVGHGVVPYKVEGNKIYVWDNNIEYPTGILDDNKYNSNEIYIEINTDGTYSVPIYNEKFNSFDKISLINIDDIHNNGNKSRYLPGFLGEDIFLTLDGSADLLISDLEGRVSGFSGGTILEEIPGVQVVIPLNLTQDGVIDNTWKQIYLPKKQDFKVIISGDKEELYDLMIAGGDYYTKVSGVQTSSGQIDTFTSKREKLQIDFDDNKKGNYNLMIDNFYNNGTGTIYMDKIKSKIEPQQYTIKWAGVLKKIKEAVKYEIDKDVDGIYDNVINLPPVYQGKLSPSNRLKLHENN